MRGRFEPVRKGRTLARRGRHEEAVAMKAVRLASNTDYLDPISGVPTLVGPSLVRCPARAS